jgi:hypothetical protein
MPERYDALLYVRISAELSKMKIGQMVKTLQPPLSLGIKEVKIKKDSLF